MAPGRNSIESVGIGAGRACVAQLYVRIICLGCRKVMLCRFLELPIRSLFVLANYLEWLHALRKTWHYRNVVKKVNNTCCFVWVCFVHCSDHSSTCMPSCCDRLEVMKEVEWLFHCISHRMGGFSHSFHSSPELWERLANRKPRVWQYARQEVTSHGLCVG